MAVVTAVDLPLLTANQVSDLIGVPAKTVLHLAREERLPSVKIGRRVLFSRQAIEQAIAAAMEHGRPV
ncbi:MAG: helix-turn-helix domain-containing protein [Solirubrobacteraceae bacterium]|nr:helix-turn-helix domain-containing protein [Solirubrobacteraceae bacterium]